MSRQLAITLQCLVALTAMAHAAQGGLRSDCNTNGFDDGDEMGPFNGYAMHFNGVDQYVDMSSALALSYMTYYDEFTLELWVRTTDTSRSVLIGNCDGTPERCWNLEIYDRDPAGHIRFAGKETDSVYFYDCPIPIADGNWHHVAVTRDLADESSYRVYIYIDGVEQSSHSADWEPYPTPWSPNIGCDLRPETETRFFGGALDELRVWNRGLSNSDIVDGMYTKLTGTESGLTANIPFDEGYGDFAWDLAGGRRGELQGAEWLPQDTDCNENNSPNECDIASGASTDCNFNGIPDECEPNEDCNTNSIPDICEIATGLCSDCNDNLVPDACDISSGASEDCQPDTIPDDCQTRQATVKIEIRTDQWGSDTTWELAEQGGEVVASGGPYYDITSYVDIVAIDMRKTYDFTIYDRHGDGICCDWGLGYFKVYFGDTLFCEGDDFGDSVTCSGIGGVPVWDCNVNGIPDDCDLASGGSKDCNRNALPDECELAAGSSLDCNGNDIPDECDLASGSSEDCNTNGFPDECESGPIHGHAILLDGVNDYVDLDWAYPLRALPSDTFLLAAWVRTSDTDNSVIIGNYRSDEEPFWNLEIDDSEPAGHIRFIHSDGTTSCELHNPAVVADGAWHHVAVGMYNTVIPPATIIPVLGMFVDDVEVEVSPSFNPFVVNGPTLIGRDRRPHSPHFNGAIDDLYVWNGFVSYSTYLSRILTSRGEWQPVLPPGLQAHWRFDEGEGRICYDSVVDLEGMLSANAKWLPQNTDCNDNDVPDGCESTWLGDCNGNGIKDLCDILSETSLDCNHNDVPDECELGPSSGKALVLDGEDDYVNVGDGVPLRGLAQGDFTLEAFVRTTDSDGGTIIGNYRYPDGQYWNLGLQNDGSSTYLHLQLSVVGQPEEHLTSTSISDGLWHHVAAVRTAGPSGSVEIYVDGTLIYNAVSELGGFSIADYTMIGRDPSRSSLYLDGMIDEVRIWNIALTESRINDYIADPPSLVELGLISYWRFDEPDGLIVVDSAGINSGMLEGGTVRQALDTDCNDNDIPDACDIAEGDSEDCQPDGIPDDCQINTPSEDCNDNDVPDLCDIDQASSEDCNSNSVPDECEPDADCDDNGVPDICDIGAGLHEDCNGNFVPDSCEVDDGSVEDCQLDSIPDDCQLHDPVVTVEILTDEYGGETTWELIEQGGDVIASGGPYQDNWPQTISVDIDIEMDAIYDFIIRDTAGDGLASGDYEGYFKVFLDGELYCEGGAFEFEATCEGIAQAASWDCNNNGVPDSCDIDSGASPDCQLDGIPDDCQIATPSVRIQINTDLRGYQTTWELAEMGGPVIASAGPFPVDYPIFLNFDIPITKGKLYRFTIYDSRGDGICCGHGAGYYKVYFNNKLVCEGGEFGHQETCAKIGDPMAWDCNENGVPDDCDIADEFSTDCNSNGIPDECDMVDGYMEDCNANGVFDACDIFYETSSDCDNNGFPDECEMGPISGQALILDGVNDYVNLGSEPPLSELGEGDFTIEMWLRTSDTGRSILIGNYNGAPSWNFEIHNSTPAGRLRMYLMDGSRVEDHRTDVDVADGTWHHVAVVVDRTASHTVIFYVDGIPVKTVPTSISTFTSIHDTMIGRDPRANSHYLNGVIDELRVWKTARKEIEISGNMYRVVDHTDPNLVAYWRFEGSDTESIEDETGQCAGTIVDYPGRLPMSTDVNDNNVPDGCETTWLGDCNGNGVLDMSDISDGISEDCNENDIPDECESGPLDGQALWLDGFDDYVNLMPGGDDGIEDHVISKLSEGDFTVEAWVKTGDAGRSIIIGNYNGRPAWNLEVYNSAPAGHVQLYLADGGSWEAHHASVSIADGTWHHVAAVRSLTPAGHVSIYIDGNLISNAGSNVGPFTATHKTMIGRDPRTNSHYLEGMVDEVRLWNVARTQQEIQDSMYTRFDGFESDVVSLWQFEELSGTIAAETAYGRHGAIVGEPIRMPEDADCNSTGILNACDIASGVSEDCNSNAIPDSCEFGYYDDCNENGLSDLCEIYRSFTLDCNVNGIIDSCEIEDGTLVDNNADGRPDICEASEENYHVPDVLDAFQQLSDEGEWLGFYMSEDSPEGVPPPFDHHYQGFARSPCTGRPPVVYAGYSGAAGDPVDFGALLVVELATRLQDGERLRSNRLGTGRESYATVPDRYRDRVVAVHPTKDYPHPCGMSMVGDILAVPGGPRIPDYPGGPAPIEDQFGGVLPDRAPVRFYDCSIPTRPRWLRGATLDRVGGHGAWAVAVTRLPTTGQFYVAIPHEGGVEFYKSVQTSFFVDGAPDPDFQWVHHKHIDVEDILEDNAEFWPMRDRECEDPAHAVGACTGGGSFQSIHFINQGNELYLIGSTASDTWSPAFGFEGQDIMYLLQVTGYDQPVDGQVELIGLEAAPKRLQSSDLGPHYFFTEGILPKLMNKRRNGSFNAGAAAYVSPSGELLYYAISHHVDGPPYGSDGLPKQEGISSKFTEICRKDIVRPVSPTFDLLAQPGQNWVVDEGRLVQLDGRKSRPAIAEPWARLYVGEDFEGHKITIDYADCSQEDYNDFSKLDGEALIGLCLADNIESDMSEKLAVIAGTCASMSLDDFVDEDFCYGISIDGDCWATPPVPGVPGTVKNRCFAASVGVIPGIVVNGECYATPPIPALRGHRDCVFGICGPCLPRIPGTGVSANCTIIPQIDGLPGVWKDGCYADPLGLIPGFWDGEDCWAILPIPGIPGTETYGPKFTARGWSAVKKLFEVDWEALRIELVTSVMDLDLCGRLVDADLRVLPPPPDSLFWLHPATYDENGDGLPDFDLDNPISFLNTHSNFAANVVSALGSMPDFPNDLKEFFDEFFLSLKGFNNRAASLEWYAPVGVDLELCTQANFEGQCLILEGDGTVQSIEDLEDQYLPNPDNPYVDHALHRFRSARFRGDFIRPELTGYSWSIVAPTPADPLDLYDTTTPTPILDAADGPATALIELVVEDDQGSFDVATVEIEIRNVPPAFDEIGPDEALVDDDLVTLDAIRFNDPGPLDTHTATVDWGDGSPLEEATVTPKPSGGEIDADHLYDDGIYDVTLTVTDSDGAETSTTFTVQVNMAFSDCLDGPTAETGNNCIAVDYDGDGDVDLADFAILQERFNE